MSNKKTAKPSYRMIFANNMRVIRRLHDISQEALALEANVSRVYISEVEKGKRAVSIDIMENIANALNVRLMDLVNEDLTVKAQYGNTLE